MGKDTNDRIQQAQVQLGEATEQRRKDSETLQGIHSLLKVPAADPNDPIDIATCEDEMDGFLIRHRADARRGSASVTATVLVALFKVSRHHCWQGESLRGEPPSDRQRLHSDAGVP